MSTSPAAAAPLCVNPGGTGGCYSSIGAAVAAASPGDTISVANGTYAEMVTIGIPLSLVGASDDKTIIDASGLNNGIYIDGMDNPGLRNVNVSGFRIQHANFEGVLVTNANYVTIADNDIVDNDRSLVPGEPPACPGLPAWETGEDFDCGEAVHLSGVTHSTVAANYITRNSGGVLLSDDTGRTAQNVITENKVVHNPYECGITLASHPLYGGGSPAGVVRNMVSDNEVSDNGWLGEGAGVGVFSGAAGGQTSANVIDGNEIIHNSIPGVAFHSHGPGDNLNNNIVIENFIAANGADRDDSATSGPTGINVYGFSPIAGTLILKNTIVAEAIDVAINTGALVTAHFNNLWGYHGTVGVQNYGTGNVDAALNWWGCPGGPGASWCTSATGPNVTVAPWLSRPFGGVDDDRDHYGHDYDKYRFDFDHDHDHDHDHR